MLDFMYRGKTSGIINHPTEMLLLAEKYNIVKLKQLCVKHLSKVITVENVCEFMQLANMNFGSSSSDMKKMCMKFFKENATAILQTDGWKEYKASKPDIAEMLEAMFL